MANPRCKRCVRGESHDFRHGAGGYNYHACRCDECRTAAVDASVDRNRARRSADPDWAEKQRAYMRDYYQRTKLDQAVRRSEYSRRYKRVYRERANANARDRLSTDSGYRAKRARQLRASQERTRTPERNADDRQRYASTRRRSSAEWRERNSDYRSEYRRAYDSRKCAAVEVVTKGRNDPWSPDDDAIAATPGITPVEVARLTGRSYHAARRRISLHRRVPA